MDSETLSADQRRLLPEWLKRNRMALPKRKGRAVSQQALAAEITTARGWRIDRERYSKYESGGSPIGPDVARHLLGFWHDRGVEFDLAPQPEPAPIDPVVAAIDRQTAAIQALVDELRKWRTEDRDRLAEVEAMVREPARAALGGSGSASVVTPRAPGTSRPSQRTTEQ